jgi:hypothetical protein
MAKYKNLELVNKTLDALGSDAVNAIDDTTEAQRIASFLEIVYFDILGQGTWPHLRKIVNLEATASAYPNYLRMPDNVVDIEWLKYDVRDAVGDRPNFQDIDYCEPYEFETLVLGRDPSLSAVTTVTDYDGGDLYIYNDRHPTVWTSIDDEHIIFDSWKSTLDSEMVSAKSRAQIWREPVWDPDGEAIPDLPSRAFQGLLSELISVSQFNLRQNVNQKAEQQSRNARHQRSRRKFGRTVDATRIPNYGRRSPGAGSRGRLVVGRNNY